MAAIDIIKQRLKEDRVPEVPDEIGEKKKQMQEVAIGIVELRQLSASLVHGHSHP
jgi:hypothetical protein